MTRRMYKPRFARSTSRVVLVAAGAVLLTLSLVLPAGADDEISIDPGGPVTGEPGSVMTVAVEPVPPDLVGKSCDLRVTAENGSSIHPGNTLITSTGDSRSVIEGVEDAEGSQIDVQHVVLGETITVELQLGPDGASSMAFKVGFECTPAEPSPAVHPAQQEAPPTEPAPEVGPEPEVVPQPEVAPEPEQVLDPEPELPETPPASASAEDPTYTG